MAVPKFQYAFFKFRLSLCILLLVVVACLWWRTPIMVGGLTKQTLYVGMLDTWHGRSADTLAYAMWMDDDSGNGVFTVKQIADEAGIHPVFAVIADGMSRTVADSLASWQRQGAGIALHGLHHERWRGWSEEQVYHDIRQSCRRLGEQGFDTTRLLSMVVPPHGCNTHAIRNVVRREHCQMVTGASLVNPDCKVFQLGRIAITPHTDLDATRQVLQRAWQRRAFVIFVTHSSQPEAFSAEKTRDVLLQAKEIGFNFEFLCFPSFFDL